MFIDSHAHVYFPELAKDAEDVLRRARHFGVVGMVNVGTDLASSREALAWAGRFPNLFPTVGVHPHSAMELDDAAFSELERLAADKRVVGIGETGLDYYKSLSPVEEQREAFRRQIRLARDLGKALVVHNREADRDVLRWIREEGQGRVKGVLHCFSGLPDTAKEAVAMGFYVSFSGNVTYPKNEYLRHLAKEIPLDRLLIETDCPFLAPQAVRGRTNEPAFMRHTALALAQILGISMDVLAAATADNTARLFGFARPKPRVIGYVIDNALYVNLTQRCPTDCGFCPRDTKPVVQGHDLTMKQEPSAAEVLADLGDVSGYDEVVFCGFGESTMRLDVMKEVARALKGKGAKRLRLNTIGLGNLVNGRDIAPELAGLLDAVSVSLNSTDPAQYEKLVRPREEYRGKAWQAMVDFTKSAAERLPEVQMTVVTVPNVDIAKARAFAESLGAKFHARAYNALG